MTAGPAEARRLAELMALLYASLLLPVAVVVTLLMPELSGAEA